jgi:para-nitrobenzyl esterase
MQLVKIDSGLISGMVMGEDGNSVYVYRGIPYAASTSGENRWKPPQPLKAWKYVRECTEYMDAPPQEPPGPPFAQKARGEDCLSLNILSPTQESNARLPVMVWLHGGGYVFGCANNRLYSAIALPQNGVVLVTVNHRLGLMGLLAHSLLSTESPEGVSGNYMFLDIIAALRWVQKNIAAFGGDPNNITIFGESGGGGKVAALMASSLARGLFQKAICESGTAVKAPFFGGKLLKDVEESGQKLFEKIGVHKTADPLKAARAVPWPKLLEAEKTFAVEIEGRRSTLFTLWDAAIDGWFLKDNPTNIFKSGWHNAVPLIAGANLGELTTGMVQMPWLIPAYSAMAEGNLKAGSSSYLYIFDQVPPGWKNTGKKSTHGMELNYLFGLSDYEWDKVFPGPALPDPQLNSADETVGKTMRLMWTQFARSGDPSVKGLIQWPVWSPENEKYLYIAESLEVKEQFSKVI